MPRKYAIRSMFIPPEGWSLLEFDLSQAESWCVAHFAKDEKMIHALQYDDIHTITAMAFFSCTREEVTEQRRYIGKKGNHSLSYRQTYRAWVDNFNVESLAQGVSLSYRQGEAFWSKWHGLYPNVKNVWWEEVENELKRSRRLTNPFGRSRIFYGPWGNDLFKAATANLPQGTVADHAYGYVQPEIGMPGGMLAINEWCEANQDVANFVHTAHDSLMLEVKDEAINDVYPVVRKMYERPMVINGREFTIPVDAKVGKRWGELAKIKKAA